MALFRITVIKRFRAAGMAVEPGMSIQISTLTPLNPVSNLADKKKVNQLFINNYGVDLEKMGILNQAFLKAERI